MKSKIIGICLGALMLTACDPSATEVVAPKNLLPKGLEDCQFYNVSFDRFDGKVVRCPNSATTATYPVGKARHSTTTVDGSDEKFTLFEDPENLATAIKITRKKIELKRQLKELQAQLDALDKK